MIHQTINELPMQDFNKYMEICETLARSAASKGNSAVGSLIILKNEIVAKAEEAVSTKQDVSCHAEMEVIRKAGKIIGKDMSQAILISTKEPCVMCSYAIRYHKIGYVVYKERTEKLGGSNGYFNLLTSDMVPQEWGSPTICFQLKP
ncbi:nucleoside deaminase [Flagellimonas hymeniacidonis]|uniref:Nucleoside deaminase n=1 Tax=Flagellimonas hymeniacidonis TaxID=2603628 RepID=A0A5C8V9D4_9FLAO|nr:nucleoside deaminase [Flagellimonas hymeniacidonis]TXN38277.1 nucleoside deaminase [Flagellimonas hymeniacidonis]